MNKILIVDDDEKFSNLIKLMFNAKGFNVVCLNHGKEVSQMMQDEKPDLVILDHMMPDFSGIQVLKEIKAQNQDIHIIMLTGCKDPNIKKEALHWGASAHLTKPFSPMELYKKATELVMS